MSNETTSTAVDLLNDAIAKLYESSMCAEALEFLEESTDRNLNTHGWSAAQNTIFAHLQSTIEESMNTVFECIKALELNE